MRVAILILPALLALALGPTITFTESAATAGIHAEMRCGGPEKRWIPEANGSGLAWLDFDNDGLLDLLIVNGSTMEQLRKIVAGLPPTPAKQGVYLFRNTGNGHFEDVTEKAGLHNDYWGTGANAADFDNDGYTDLLITTIGVDLLFHNNGNGTFSEVSQSAGLSRAVAWHTGSAFGDFDNDGFLDFYVAGYADIHAISLSEPAPVCKFLDIPGFCGPIGLKPEHGVLYHNNGNGTFTDVTQKSGLAAAKPSHSFTPVFDDFNGDGKIDLFVANDSDPNFLFINQGNGTFKESGLDQGVAFNADGRVQSNMGVAIENSAAAGKVNLVTTTFSDDYFPLFEQDKSGSFEELSSSKGLVRLTRPYLGWSCGFVDFDNDGHRELWTANGHVYPKAPRYFQPIKLFRRDGTQFIEAWSYPPVPDNSYRAGAAGDYDNDGLVDLVILPISGQPLVLHNTTAVSNSWVGLQLVGTRSNRDAIGTTVKIEACGITQFESVRSGGSYISHNDSRLHFGLGSCSKVERLTIRWPRGTEQTVDYLAVDRYTRIEEPRIH